MPMILAFSGDISSLYPVVSMIGMSGLEGQDFFCEVLASKFRHCHVSKHDVKLVWILLKYF